MAELIAPASGLVCSSASFMRASIAITPFSSTKQRIDIELADFG